jgi:hypothetical protein
MSKKIFFISDFFSDQIVGGAELTSDALISRTAEKVQKVRSTDLTIDFLNANKNHKWIFGNFALLDQKIIFKILKMNLDYEVIEYDFKFCALRSPKKHISHTGTCDCKEKTHGKLISLFFSKAKRIWFMSEKQKEVYLKQFKFLKNSVSGVLSSVFKEETLQALVSFENKKNDKFIILDSSSWIKGKEACVEFAKKNKIKYELVSNLSHQDMLIKMSQSKGLIFLPLGGDTCPRITIEAKLLGCKLHLNENVLHKDEPWFTGTKQEMFEYLQKNGDNFWEIVCE